MATSRREVWIDRPADEVWAIVGDPAAMASWFPRVASVTVDGDVRTVTTGSGIPLDERIVNVRGDLRRFQYRLVGPLPVEHHLGTIDVIPDGADRCLVVYGTDVVPHALAYVLDGAIGDALESLKRLVETGVGPEPVTA